VHVFLTLAAPGGCARRQRSGNAVTAGGLWSGIQLDNCQYQEGSYTVEENLLTVPGTGEVLALTDSNGANMVPLHDALGSTVGVVGSSGTVQTYLGYTPFGSYSETGTPYYYPFLFGGTEWSDQGNVSQLDYAGARYSSPSLRRFISADPMGFAGSGTNLFAYARKDPVNNTDPTGMWDPGWGEESYYGWNGDPDLMGDTPSTDGWGAPYGTTQSPQPGSGWGGRWPVLPVWGPPTSITDSVMAAQSGQGYVPTRNNYLSRNGWAIGLTLEISTINPWSSGGGGLTA